ncbi:ATPase involved in DNA repair [Synechococcus sp. PCC 7502]|uniref:AAA family ATPase n=1 Tax=Synechococcus sp. PCC 7502 TaxID=1173263 RepID=UPI00029FE240|nr:SMC family ATPase [Synechococcus sp. PCC 7502]AFY75241.1 ATPase involved in DNA repair [Synechococcus sp. PCC 7502]
MRLISLYLENFRQHKSTQIHFPTGLIGILGENGSGKTTILEAIAWALYGKITRGDNDSVIWRMAEGKSTAVAELTFAFNGQTLKVKRSQSSSKSNAELTQNQKIVATSTKAVNEKILELLAMTHQEFFNSYFTGQKDLNFLGSIKGAVERERFIAKMLGYEKISEVQGAAGKEGTIRFDLRQQERTVDRLQGALGDQVQIEDAIILYQNQLTEANHQLAEVTAALTLAIAHAAQLEPQLNQLQQQRDQHYQLTAQVQNYQTQQARLIKEISQKIEQRSQIYTATQIYETLAVEVANYQAMETELAALTNVKQEFTKKTDLELRLTHLNQELQSLEQDLDLLKDIDISHIRQAIAHSQAQLEHINLEIQTQTQTWQTTQAELKAKIKTEQQNLSKLANQQQVILAAGVEGICPTCERPLHSEYENVVEGFTSQLDHLRSHLKTWENELADLKQTPVALKSLQQTQTQIADLIKQQQQEELKISTDLTRFQLLQNQQNAKTQEIKQLQVQISHLPHSFDLDRYNHLSSQIQSLKPKYEQYLRSQGISQRLHEIDGELVNLNQEQSQLQNLLSKLEQEIQQLKFKESEYSDLKQAIATANQNLDRIRTQQAQAQQQQALITQALTTAQKQADEYRLKQAEYQTAKKEQILLQELDNAFTDMRQHFTEEIRPQLADAASIFLNQLTDGRYNTIEIDSKYNVIVLADGDRKPVISGGEEDIVNLSLRLAISQMITERSGQPFSLLILDEVFGSLDDGRRNNVLALLNALEQQFEQVLIISHLDSIKDNLNHTIRLEFNAKEQCSQVADSLV